MKINIIKENEIEIIGEREILRVKELKDELIYSHEVKDKKIKSVGLGRTYGYSHEDSESRKMFIQMKAILKRLRRRKNLLK